MPTIDDKVVAINFESSKFESGVSKAIAALDKLKNSLKLPDAGKGLNDLSVAAKKVNLSDVARGIDGIKQKLGYLSVAALATFATIAQQAVAAAGRMLKAFTIQPILAGFTEYTTNLNAVQTILANTAAAGTKMKDVNAALQELNRYSDKTIYNFAEMARNIGTFTAAGVGLKPAVAAIKGIANLAALSGSNSQQASTAMYQLSQAISAGRVSLQDWNSVVNAGMGGTVFQRALAQTAVAMGKLPASALKLVGPMKNVSIHGQSFRQSMMAAPGKQSWLTSDVLTKTLQQFTGDMSDAELKAQGFNDAQIKAIQSQAKMAMQAATQVKTLTQVLDVAKETAQSGWAQTWQIVFGNFGEAKTTFTALSNSINGFINASANARNKVLNDWKALGGRTVLISSIKTAFQNLGLILKPIKEAFRDIFPAKTGQDLYNLTLRFKAFAEALKPSPETVKNLHRSFAGFFALLDIGKQVLGGIFHVFGRLFGVLGNVGGSFLGITGNLGDFLVALDKAMRKGTGLGKFFDGLANILVIPLNLLKAIAEALANMFDGFSPGGFSGQMDGITKAATPFKRIVEAIAQAVEGLGPAISKAVSNINFDLILSMINTGLFAGLVLMLRRFIGGATLEKVFGAMGAGFGKKFAGGVLGKLGGALGGLTGSLKAMQSQLQAKTLEEIAIAVALLAASLVGLSMVDPAKLDAALGAMTLAFAELLGAMKVMSMLTSSKAFLKMPFIAASMIMLAGAIDLLAIAVIALSRLSWNEIVKGLTATSGLLTALTLASGPLSKNAGGMIRAGIGIIAIAAAMKIFASAMADFGALSWTEISKGLISVGVGLGIIVGAARVMPKGMVSTGAGLVIMAAGLKLLADAVAKFGAMNWNTLGKGLLGVGGGLTAIAIALRLMPKNMVLLSTGLYVVALSLGKVVDAVAKMGAMSIEKLAKGLVALGGALLILAAALHAMSGTMGGAIALTAAAVGIASLSKSLVSLGKQSWTSIIKSMTALGASLTIIGLAARLLTPAIPALLGFGAALILIGGGLALAGAGIALIGVGLSAIAVSGPIAIGILINALIDLAEAIPRIVGNLVLGLLEIVKQIAAVAPQFVKSMIIILNALLDVVIQSSTKIAEAFVTLIVAGIKALAAKAPDLIKAGFKILMDLLKGIRDHVIEIVKMGADIVVNFLRGIANNVVRIVAAGANLVVKFLQGIASNVSKIIAAGADVIVHFLAGIGSAGAKIVAAGVNAMITFINALSSNSVKLLDAGAKAIINFLNGVADTIEKREPEMIAAGGHIGEAIVVGMVKGLVAWAPKLYDKAKEIGKKALGFLGDVMSIFSPSKKTYEMGKYLIEGLVNGLDQNSKLAYGSVQTFGNGIISAFNDVFQTHSPSKVLEQIGRFVGQGFARGLIGSGQDINAAFADLNQRLTTAMSAARQTIATEQAKLKQLREADKPDQKAIAEAQKVIAQNQTILAASTAAHTTLVKTLRDEKGELLKLAKDYETVSGKLEAANEILAQAKQKRDDAFAGYQSQYGALPEIPTTTLEGEPVGDQLSAYQQAIANQITATTAYQDTLEQLRKLGLDDVTYQKLLTEGPADQAFANQLLAGGKTAVDGLNKLDAQLLKVSTTLATNAANNLYQAGVDAAQGVVKGLQSQESEIKKAMEKIAEEMIKAIKKKLKIKSPSQIFIQLGKLSGEGLIQGFTDSAQNVSTAVGDIANNALLSLRKNLGGMSDLISRDIDLNPTIQPVLDLSQMRKEAANIKSMLPSPVASIGLAAAISTTQQAKQTSESTTAPVGSSFSFEQNNYSPKALTEVEIYRQTKNQLSIIKTALAV